VNEETDATEQIADAMATQLAPREEKNKKKNSATIYNKLAF
jgi:hypothetical protein